MRDSFRFYNKVVALASLFFVSAARADFILNMSPGVTPVSQDIYDLHMTIFWICVAIGVLVFGILFYSLIKHRKSRGHQAAGFHEHTKLEIFWSIVPLLILVIMAIPATKVLMHMDDDSKADVNIKITGYQWKWKYEYLDEGISYFSNLSTPMDQLQNKSAKNAWYLLEVDKPLVLPIHKKIRFLVTSNDVIHSWWVPALGIKRDAIPGFIYEAWARIDKPGIYRGQCAELCGLNHGFMPIVVEAVTEADYEKWIAANAPPGTVPGTITNTTKNPTAPAAQTVAAMAAKTYSKDELMQNGEKVYSSNCAVCHKPDGAGMPPAFPAMKGSKVAEGAVAHHIDIVLHGVKGTAMQAWADQLSDDDIAAVITYERNAWGNGAGGGAAGGIVQPVDIAKARASASH